MSLHPERAEFPKETFTEACQCEIQATVLKEKILNASRA